jgi:hypothetical protein
VLLLAVLVLACGGSSPAPETTPAAKTPEPVTPLIVTPLSGQKIPVVPLTLIVAQEPLDRDAPLSARTAALAWADSLLGAALTSRGPEVDWVLPAELRKIARRAPTIAPDPDRMGQSMLRIKKLKDVPDPLRSDLRSLTALAGGRYALVPAALGFLVEPDGQVRAELSLVLADTRNGRVVWRSLAWGVGATPERALVAALETVLPVGLGLR